MSGVPEPAQGKRRNCIVRSMGGGKESKTIPSWPWEAGRLALLLMGPCPEYICILPWCQEWLKQLLSLPFSDWICSLSAREDWTAVIYSLMCGSTEVLSWGSSGIQDVKCDGVGCGHISFSCPCCGGSHFQEMSDTSRYGWQQLLLPWFSAAVKYMSAPLLAHLRRRYNRARLSCMREV